MNRLIAITAALVALVLTACQSGTPPKPQSDTATPLTVFAAASLKAAFTELGREFTTAHPGAEVRFQFDGSSGLVDQLRSGAPADVFASADEKNMTKAAEAGLVEGQPTRFATNVLTLVTPPGNPGGVTGLDSSLAGKKLVVCAPGVPCGTATEKLAKDLGVTLQPVSREQKVTDVLGKVTSGEADAGVVYTTDAKGAGSKVETVAIKGAEKVVNTYPIAVTRSAQNAATAKAFVDHVTGEKGRAVLARHGFGAP